MSESGIPNINFEIDPADVVTVPIDDTLSIEGEAADAKAVGDALALKADKSELSTAIKVDGQSADAQGEIVLLASHIPMDASATPATVAQKISGLENRTGEDIPFDSSVGAQTIAQKVNALAAGAVITDNKATLEGSITDESTHVEGLTVNGATLPLKDPGAVRSVNGVAGDADGNVRITNVETANNLVADDAQANIGQFVLRTSGGTTSIADGKAWLTQLRGNMEHTGEVQESLTMTVNAAQREEGQTPITATINADTFKAAVSASTTITLTYTTEWSANPELIGVTVTGTPINGDEIVIVYVKGDRGLITPAAPTSFRSTGWNLYSHTAGYARVVKYSTEYGFRVDGTYTSLAFSYTLTGERTTITPAAGNFNVPADGYVWVTGGNATDTAIYMTWSDWTAGYDGSFEAYTESVISISTLMAEVFPDGLCAVGAVTDEIDFSLQRATVRIEKLVYSEETIAALIAAGRDYVADTDSIYAVLETPEVHAIQIANEYTVSDHGMELLTGTTVPVNTYTLYGQNLRDKLRTDVVTISQQQLNATQKAQVCDNIGALDAGDVVNDLTSGSTNPVSSGGVFSNAYQKTPKNRAFSSDLNNLDLIGYYFGNAANITNAPITSGYVYIIALGYIQLAFEYSSSGVKRKFVRGYENSQWYPWQVITETKRCVLVESGASTTFTWGTPYAIAKVEVYGFDSNSTGLWMLRNNNGSLIKHAISDASTISITQSGNVVTIKNNYGYGVAVQIEAGASIGDYGNISF